MLVKLIASAILACACMSPLVAEALPVYSSRVWETRGDFCHAVEATAKTVVSDGLTPELITNIQHHPVFLKLTKNEQLTVFDAVWLANRRKSSFWVFEYCMDRLET